MKQNLSRARVEHHRLLMATVICVIGFTACARQSLRSTASTKLSSTTVAPVEKPAAIRLNINTATAAEMEKLPGVGKILAERIVAHRQQYGPFRRVEHLMMVHGFSDHKFRALRELITVE